MNTQAQLNRELVMERCHKTIDAIVQYRTQTDNWTLCRNRRRKWFGLGDVETEAEVWARLSDTRRVLWSPRCNSGYESKRIAQEVLRLAQDSESPTMLVSSDDWDMICDWAD